VKEDVEAVADSFTLKKVKKEQASPSRSQETSPSAIPSTIEVKIVEANEDKKSEAKITSLQNTIRLFQMERNSITGNSDEDVAMKKEYTLEIRKLLFQLNNLQRIEESKADSPSIANITPSTQRYRNKEIMNTSPPSAIAIDITGDIALL